MIMVIRYLGRMNREIAELMWERKSVFLEERDAAIELKTFWEGDEWEIEKGLFGFYCVWKCLQINRLDWWVSGFIFT